jgi:hypothetical protein
MKNYVILFLFFITAEATLFAQAKTYDIMSYNPPLGWSKEDKLGWRMYSYVDRTNQTYGMINIYVAAPSSGNAQKDFTLTWNTLVKQSFSTAITPVPSIIGPKDGYEGYKGTTLGKASGKPITVTLINYTGGGKTLSIVLSYSDTKFETIINKFLDSIKLKSPGGEGKKE